MGLGIGDFDTDGHLDIFKTHFRGDTNVLYRDNGKGTFRDVTIRAGLGVETRFVGWGAGIVDLDNDGLPDIFFTTGMVYPDVEQKSRRAVQDARTSSSAISAAGNSKNCSTRPAPASTSRIPAAAWRSATSITMATSTS